MDTIEKLLKARYVTDKLYSHVSMCGMKGTFRFNREDMELFWNLYCDYVKNGGLKIDEPNKNNKEEKNSKLETKEEDDYTLLEEDEKTEDSHEDSHEEEKQAHSEKPKRLMMSSSETNSFSSQPPKRLLQQNNNTQSSTKRLKKPYGIGENPQAYLPVIVDLDIKIKENPESPIGVDKLYTDNHVNKVIEIYQSILRTIVDDCSDEQLTCVLLEKPLYKVSKDNNNVVVKNGFHLHFPFILLSRIHQEMHLIPRVKDKLNEEKVFNDIGFEDSGSLIDKTCCKVAWLIYGCVKNENYLPYLVSKVIDANGDTIDLEEAFKYYKIYDHKEKLIKIAGNVEYYLPRILSIIPYGRESHDLIKTIKLPYKENVQNREKDANFIKVSVTEALKIASKLLPMLAQYRVDDRNEWMTIGWLLFNIGDGTEQALQQWLNFSGRSDSYDEAVCAYEWERMSKRDLTLGSLRYYASIDSPLEYAKFKQEQSDFYIKESITGSHNDIAKVLFAQFGLQYVCASITNKIWYQYIGNKWEQIEDGVFLRMTLSDEIAQQYTKIGQDLFLQSSTCQDKAEQSTLQARLKLVQKIIQHLKESPFKSNVMRECLEVFYDKKFKEKLDMNPYIIGFRNGVYDLKLNVFRKGKPEDYISKCMPFDHVEFSENDQRVKDVYDYLEKVFPDKSVRQYFLDQSSDVFVGGNHQKVVNYWVGEGNNAKSVTQNIFEKMLGPLAIKFSTTLITGKKISTGAAAPELSRSGGGVRWAVLEEPDGGEECNIGMLKSLSGNDSFWARDLFETGKNAKEITPMFKLIFICLAEGTTISLSSGISVSIEKLNFFKKIKKSNVDDSYTEIYNNSYCKLLSYNNISTINSPHDVLKDKMINTDQNALIDNGIRPCITLTLLDGREIVCTENHKFLSNNNTWISARDILINKTVIKMSMSFPKCDDMFEQYNMIFKIEKFSFNFLEHYDRIKASALCRILGYIIEDDEICISEMVTENDKINILDDIEMFTGHRNHNIIPTIITEITSVSAIPSFIFSSECPKFLIREVLSAFFGKNGILPRIKDDKMSPLKVEVAESKQFFNETIKIMTCIAKLLYTKFNITNTVNYSSCENDTITISIIIAHEDDILTFADNIGFRYNFKSSKIINAISACIRYKKTLYNRHNKLMQRAKDIMCSENNMKNFKDIFYEISDGKVPFELTYNLSKFVKDTKLNLLGDTYTMTVTNKTFTGQRHVYDLNVEEPFSNFVAEGLITHNCNKLPKMKYTDAATWGRIKVIPFESQFIRSDDPNPPPETYEEQIRQKKFPMDPCFSDKIPDLIPAFCWVLLEHRKKLTVRIIPSKVLSATAMYKRQNDIYKQFVEENIIEDGNKHITLIELYSNFKEWYKLGFPNSAIPVKNDIQDYFGKLWENEARGRGWDGYRIRTLKDDNNIVVLGNEDLIDYNEDDMKAPM